MWSIDGQAIWRAKSGEMIRRGMYSRIVTILCRSLFDCSIRVSILSGVFARATALTRVMRLRLPPTPHEAYCARHWLPQCRCAVGVHATSKVASMSHEHVACHSLLCVCASENVQFICVCSMCRLHLRIFATLSLLELISKKYHTRPIENEKCASILNFLPRLTGMTRKNTKISMASVCPPFRS